MIYFIVNSISYDIIDNLNENIIMLVSKTVSIVLSDVPSCVETHSMRSGPY